jgi:hypothetical protein
VVDSTQSSGASGLEDLADESPERRAAVLAVTTHAAEQWPSGVYCRNDRAPFPCRLHLWGQQVLRDAGWGEDDIDNAVRLAEDGILPWSNEPSKRGPAVDR